MNKAEYKKCEDLMKQTIKTAYTAQTEYESAKQHLKTGNRIEWETRQKSADQHYGEAVGVHNVLSVLGFEHDRMKELFKLI